MRAPTKADTSGDRPQAVPSSLRRRVVLSTVALTGLVMVLMVLIVQLVLAQVVSSNVDRELEDRADEVLSTIRPGHPVPDNRVGADERLDAGVLVFDRSGRLSAGVVPEKLEHAVDSLRTSDERRFVDVGETERLLAVPFDEGAGGVVVVAEPLGPYERSEAYALLVTVVLGVVVTLGAGLVAAFAVRRSLQPVLAMAETAEDWSEHDPSRRFDQGPPTNELTALAATLDRLLDRVVAALQTEQRLTGDIAHELRTPLTGIIGTADLALLEPDLPAQQRTAFREIADSARRLNETVTTLVELARSPGGLAGSPATVGGVVDLLDSTVATAVDDAQRHVRLGVPDRLVLRALNPVVENAVRFGDWARVTVRVEPTSVGFVVNDGGPGLRDGQDPFSPGPGGGGTGLGLALSRRVARSGGGDVFAETARAGAQFVVQMPRQ
jgi:two-component system OmpR family sensor kinase